MLRLAFFQILAPFLYSCYSLPLLDHELRFPYGMLLAFFMTWSLPAYRSWTAWQNWPKDFTINQRQRLLLATGLQPPRGFMDSDGWFQCVWAARNFTFRLLIAAFHNPKRSKNCQSTRGVPFNGYKTGPPFMVQIKVRYQVPPHLGHRNLSQLPQGETPGLPGPGGLPAELLQRAALLGWDRLQDHSSANWTWRLR